MSARKILKRRPRGLAGGTSNDHRELVARSQMFLESWYIRTYPEVVTSRLAPLDHYLRRGARQGFNPSPFFDTCHYVSRYPDVPASGLNPLVHYLMIGARESREPNPWFNPQRTDTPAPISRAAPPSPTSATADIAPPPRDVPDPGPAIPVAAQGMHGPNLLERPRIVRAPSPPAASAPFNGVYSTALPEQMRRLSNWTFWRSQKVRVRDRDRRVIERSGLLFEEWYLETYPDVAAKTADPILHYLRFGAAEGRDPSPFFDTSFYLTHNPDVRASNINPLVHYVLHGYREHRPPNQWFDPSLHLPDFDEIALSDRIPIVEFIARLSRSPSL